MNKTTVIPVERVWLTNRDAQSYLGVSPDFLKRLRAEARIPFYKVGGTVFYRKRDIDRIVERGRVV